MTEKEKREGRKRVKEIYEARSRGFEDGVKAGEKRLAGELRDLLQIEKCNGDCCNDYD